MCVFFVLEQQGKEMMAGGVCERVAAISLIAVLLQLAGLTLFVLGFFPVKPALMGISGIESVKPVCNYEEEATHKGASYQEVSGITPQYDRLIIMVSFICLTFHLLLIIMPFEHLFGSGLYIWKTASLSIWNFFCNCQESEH
jgi:hypothetical protein